MRLVAYLRVSTDVQRDGYGLEVQADTIKRWARGHRHRIVRWERDEGISGAAPPDQRPGLARALAALTLREADGIVVARLDRLSRELVMQEQLLLEIRRAGGRLHSTVQGEDHVLEEAPEDPTRALIRQVIGAVAEWERSIIRLRMKAGRAKKRAEGGYIGGQPPYGYRSIRGQLVPHAAEQKIVRGIVRRRRAGQTMQQICDWLNDNPEAVRRTGGKWWPDTVREVLIREGVQDRTEHELRQKSRRGV